jgi:hypothetical protein
VASFLLNGAIVDCLGDGVSLKRIEMIWCGREPSYWCSKLRWLVVLHKHNHQLTTSKAPICKFKITFCRSTLLLKFISF